MRQSETAGRFTLRGVSALRRTQVTSMLAAVPAGTV